MKIIHTPKQSVKPKNTRARVINNDGTDFYPTDYILVEDFFAKFINVFQGDKFFDPTAGQEGHRPFIDTAKRLGYNAEYCELAEGLDFFEHSADKKYDLIVTNPPFNLAEQIIEKLIDQHMNPGGTIVLLLRVNFLGSVDRATNLWSKDENKPAGLTTIAPRPSFSGDGGTDMTEYAWYVFGNTSRIKNFKPLMWHVWPKPKSRKRR